MQGRLCTGHKLAGYCPAICKGLNYSFEQAIRQLAIRHLHIRAYLPRVPTHAILCMMKEFALYLHIPFCQSRCSYCDFNTYAGLTDLRGRYVDALCQEIARQGMHFQTNGHAPMARSIYLGGGTPTILTVDQIACLLDACTSSFSVIGDAETTIEANPVSVNRDYLTSLHQIGVNRISLGVQSFSDNELALLGRLHDAVTAQRAFVAARQAGFQNINLDLIYGLPNQHVHRWQETLRIALSLEPEHLSLYALGVEVGTPLHRDVLAGRVPTPDPDVAADQYELAEDLLADAGYVHYEISNWARGSIRYASQHNMFYWHNQPYLGLGAGAHSWVSGMRFANVPHPTDYIQRLEQTVPSDHSPEPWSPAILTETLEHIPREMEMAETMILGLRLVEEGVSSERFGARFGRSFKEVYENVLPDLVNLQLLEYDAKRLRLSRRGRLLGNEVFQRFLPA